MQDIIQNINFPLYLSKSHHKEEAKWSTQECIFTSQSIKQDIIDSRPNIFTRILDYLFGDGIKTDVKMSLTALSIIAKIETIDNLSKRTDAINELIVAIQQLGIMGKNTNITNRPKDVNLALSIISGDLLGNIFKLVSFDKQKELLTHLAVKRPSLSLIRDLNTPEDNSDDKICLKGILSASNIGLSYADIEDELNFNISFYIPSLLENEFGTTWICVHGGDDENALANKFKEVKADYDKKKTEFDDIKKKQDALEHEFDTLRASIDLAAGQIGECFKAYIGPIEQKKNYDSKLPDHFMPLKIQSYDNMCSLLKIQQDVVIFGCNKLMDNADELFSLALKKLEASENLSYFATMIKRLNSVLKINGHKEVNDALISKLEDEIGVDFLEPGVELLIDELALRNAGNRSLSVLDSQRARIEKSNCDERINRRQLMPDYKCHAEKLRNTWDSHVSIKDDLTQIPSKERAIFLKLDREYASISGIIVESDEGINKITKAIAQVRKDKDDDINNLATATQIITTETSNYLGRIAVFKYLDEFTNAATDELKNLEDYRNRLQKSVIDSLLKLNDAIDCILIDIPVRCELPAYTPIYNTRATLSESDTIEDLRWMYTVEDDVSTKTMRMINTYPQMLKSFKELVHTPLFQDIMIGGLTENTSSHAQANILLNNGLSTHANKNTPTENSIHSATKKNLHSHVDNNDTKVFITDRVRLYLDKIMAKNYFEIYEKNGFPTAYIVQWALNSARQMPLYTTSSEPPELTTDEQQKWEDMFKTLNGPGFLGD
ncbi:TPA: hypothetical protein PXM37_004305 [Yersinia enterocolitica]|nr:hypothetical protein [Yersinia enterocolitica]HDL6985339.1 hypothetical protein [Yersinia enterocolitica]HDL7067879.1 hypothetical protein [Yersinia enterocolitica]HDL7072270.1 hypothetical protein [Yersinia enterocolitica]